MHAWIFVIGNRVAIDSLLPDISGQTATDVHVMERRRRIIVTLIWFIISLLFALFIPDIGVVISLLGGLAAIFIFVFPGQFCRFRWSHQQCRTLFCCQRYNL